tara:strand:- start:292 stop:1311 length:1020 start_codon:yes stop_codon:yes gene_type:complete
MKLSGQKTLGLILAITGSALIVFSVSMYILGIYSESKLDDLNASIQVDNVDATKIVVIDDKNTDKDFVHAKEQSHHSFVVPPDNKSVEQPEKTIALSVEKKEYAKENNLFFLTPQPESMNLEIQVKSHSITPLLNGYASNDFVSSIHPKDWADPTWAGENESPQIITDKSSSERVANLTVVDLMQLPLTMQIPAIGVDSSIENLKIIQKDGEWEYETPKNIVGRIPYNQDFDSSVTGWYFGHLESPIKSEGNVFHNLPDVADMLRDGDPVYVLLSTDKNEFVYQAIKSQVMHESDLKLYDPGNDHIVLVTCSNRPYYDHRQLVTAKLVDVKLSEKILKP